MDIMLIDFDAKFSDYIKNWLDENAGSFENMDAVEAMMPDLYAKWLDSPQEFLSGKKPGKFFMDFEAEDLINLMIRYEIKKIGVPDPLLDAISSKKREALPHLHDIVFKEGFLPDNIDAVALRITALNLINEIDASGYIGEYIDCISKRAIDGGVAESMVDSIKQYSKDHKDKLISAMENADSNSVKNRLLDILCALPYDKKVYDELLSMFKSSDEKALYASYLGKYGNADAVEALRHALDWININYLDYIEIRNAIEELGEEVTHVRDFEGDKYFESMKGLYDD